MKDSVPPTTKAQRVDFMSSAAQRTRNAPRSADRLRASHHSGRINSLWLLSLGALASIVFLTGLLMQTGPSRQSSANRVTMYCAAGLREPVEQIARKYEEEYGAQVDLQFGGSGTLLNQIEINKFDTADLYLAADDIYTRQAVDKGLASEVLPVAEMRLVVAVPKGNPKRILTLDDLLRDDLIVAVPSPDQAAAGRATRKLLHSLTVGKTNRWAQLEEQVKRSGVFKPTVNEVANDVKIGAADAGLVWDFTVVASGYRDAVEAVSLSELESAPSRVSLAVLNTSQPTASLRFARYLTARDRGLPIFAAAGLRPIDGDAWSERPEINFFCGAVNRRAVEKIVQEFSEREGVVVNTIYDGCGILTGRMKTISEQRTDLGFPDIYMACDVYYLDNVADWFQDVAHVSSTELVLAVPKNSQTVRELADLIQPGVRVAVGEPDQCTVGALTRRLLVQEGLYEKLKAKQSQSGEVVVEKSSSALLIPDVVTGHVDVAVAYLSDTKANSGAVDIIRIESPSRMAVQPLSIARSSDHKILARRLYNRVTSSPAAFADAGFEFRFAPTAPNAIGRAATVIEELRDE